MARIAVDAMGGDFAPRAPIAGALHALAALPSQHSIELVGRTAVIEAELDALLSGELAGLAAHRARGNGEYDPLRVVAEADLAAFIAREGAELVPPAREFLRRLGLPAG